MVEGLSDKRSLSIDKATRRNGGKRAPGGNTSAVPLSAAAGESEFDHLNHSLVVSVGRDLPTLTLLKYPSLAATAAEASIPPQQKPEVQKTKMDSSQFREAAHAAIEEIIQYYDTIESRRVLSDVSPGYLRELIPPSAPQTPEPWSSIQPDIERVIMPGLTHWQSPNFMAFFPAHSTYPSMLGELYSAAFTAPAFNWLCSPAVTELETVVLDWLAQLLALPECYLSKGEGGGVVQGSASEAIVTVMVAARERALRNLTAGLQEAGREKEREDRVDSLRGKLVALGSEHAHSSTQKGAIIAGTKFRSVPAGRQDGFAMTGKALRRVLEDCERDGLVPYYLTATLGTTSTCAVDRFEEIAEVLKDYPNVWVHVDAAYAGAALVCEEYQHDLAPPLAHFDSFDMNMHKWLLTNFDASCLFVKKRSDLTAALSITPSYLRNSFSDSGLVTDYRDWQIPLGRRFRALKIWFVLRAHGADGLRAHIRAHVRLGELFCALVRERADVLELVAGPAFALNVVSVVPRRKWLRSRAAGAAAAAASGGGGGGRQRRVSVSASQPDPDHEAYLNDFTSDAEEHALLEANEITKEVYETINKRGEIFLTSGIVGGVYVIRVVASTPRVEERHVRRAFDILVKTAEEVLEGKAGDGGAVDGSA
ncbi:aromatic-l-amino-acid decarboxylase [Diplodia corticola]|uniref:Aromatic-l-amino-acid decarboxylase n=1 Tax=Diplodia corticola TaxID=236234 RepID=A0A1J9QXW8_9PEZI|nr:aromatic-l-amino-acid decarboxylase [Diplodia corticola]OJD33240.1 aromatic-l-amino-acid decarboxylase [Diplodia corticola]